MFHFAPKRETRKPSLTPMIDVVFLLLVFFMLAARFGQDVAIPLTTSGAGAAYQGPPRLIEVSTDQILLNGLALSMDEVLAQLPQMMRAPSDTVILRPLPGSDLQRLIVVHDALRAGGLSHIVLVE